MKEIPDSPDLLEIEMLCSWKGCERTADAQYMAPEWKYLILATATGSRTGDLFGSKTYGILCPEHAEDLLQLLRIGDHHDWHRPVITS